MRAAAATQQAARLRRAAARQPAGEPRPPAGDAATGGAAAGVDRTPWHNQRDKRPHQEIVEQKNAGLGIQHLHPGPPRLPLPACARARRSRSGQAAQAAPATGGGGGGSGRRARGPPSLRRLLGCSSTSPCGWCTGLAGGRAHQEAYQAAGQPSPPLYLGAHWLQCTGSSEAPTALQAPGAAPGDGL